MVSKHLQPVQCKKAKANVKIISKQQEYTLRYTSRTKKEGQNFTMAQHDLTQPQEAPTTETPASTHGQNPQQHTFTFMGTGAGCGVPAFFCDCPACEEARANPHARRGDCGVMIRGAQTLLIDTPPDVRHQLIRENVREIHELLFTHCHSDHVSGLCEMEYMMQLRTRHAIPTFASDITLQEINTEFHYMAYALDEHVIQPFDTHVFDGVCYTALPVTHAQGTYGYLIETETTRLFYASDTGRLPAQTAERIQGVDILAMDATYWKSCPAPQAHHCVQSCIEEGFELGAKKIYLTHLALHYMEPITLCELNHYLEQYEGRVEAAADGLSFAI